MGPLEGVIQEVWDGGGQGAWPLEAVQALKAIHFWIWELFRNMHIYQGRRSEQGGARSAPTKRVNNRF